MARSCGLGMLLSICYIYVCGYNVSFPSLKNDCETVVKGSFRGFIGVFAVVGGGGNAVGVLCLVPGCGVCTSYFVVCASIHVAILLITLIVISGRSCNN